MFMVAGHVPIEVGEGPCRPLQQWLCKSLRRAA